MNMHDIPPDIGKHLAGPAGSLIALIWLSGNLMRKCAMFGAGWIFSLNVAPPVATWLSVPEGFSGFVLGLFGMAIVDKIFEVWRSLEIGPLVMAWSRKRLGLDKEGS